MLSMLGKTAVKRIKKCGNCIPKVQRQRRRGIGHADGRGHGELRWHVSRLAGLPRCSIVIDGLIGLMRIKVPVLDWPDV